MMTLTTSGQEPVLSGSEDKRTLEQKRADHAIRTIKKLIELDQSQPDDGKNSPIYGNLRNYVESLPATIVMNGLGQALATELALAKIGEGGGSKADCDLDEAMKSIKPSTKGGRDADKRAHEILFSIVQDWLQSRCIFSWEKIPGEDEENFKNFLTNQLGISWARKAKIEKIDDGKSIKASHEDNLISIKINDRKTEAILEINTLRKHKFRVIEENEEINIYQDGKVYFSKDKSLMESIVEGNQDLYVRAQVEALAYLEWLKKFSQAFLRKGGKNER